MFTVVSFAVAVIIADRAAVPFIFVATLLAVSLAVAPIVISVPIVKLRLFTVRTLFSVAFSENSILAVLNVKGFPPNVHTA